MKRNMKLGSIAAMVIVGLMIVSSFTAAIRTTSITPSFSETQTNAIAVKHVVLKGVERTSSPKFTLQSITHTNHEEMMIDGATVIGGGGKSPAPAVGVSTPHGNAAPTGTKISQRESPTVADNSLGHIIMANRITNDTYKNVGGKNPVQEVYGAINYWQQESDISAPYHPQYAQNYPGGGNIRWNQTQFAYAGVKNGQEYWYGMPSEKDNNLTGSATIWNESGRVSIIRIMGNNPLSIANATMFRYRPWFGFMYMGGTSTGSFRDIKMPSIASTDHLYFPRNNTPWIFWSNGTHKPYSLGGGGGEPFGIIAYIVGKDRINTRSPNEAHVGFAREYWRLPMKLPPVGIGVNAYMTTYSWTPIPGNCTAASTYIDQKQKIGYAAFDEGIAGQKYAMWIHANNMSLSLYGWSNGSAGDSVDHPDFDLLAMSWYSTDPNMDMEHCSIAAYDGAVVGVNELNNRVDPTDCWLNFWHNTLYNGTIWGDSDLNIGFVGNPWVFGSLSGARYRNPIVHHFEGRTFYLTVEIDRSGESPPAPAEIGFAISYDGGATWGPTEDSLSMWTFTISDTYPPVLGVRTTAASDNMIQWTHNYNASWTDFVSLYITSVLTGTVYEALGNPAQGATVDFYNENRAANNTNGYALRSGPVLTDLYGNYKKKLIGGIEIVDGDIMTIIAGSNSMQQVGVLTPISWDPLDYVNAVPDITMDVHYLDLTDFPFYWAYYHDPLNPDGAVTDTGAATAQMILNYIWAAEQFTDQNALFTAFNTQGGSYISGDEMSQGLNTNAPTPLATYGYSFSPVSSATQSTVVQQICVWLDYEMSYFNAYHDPDWPAPGHPNHVPVAVPFGGSYENWVAVRGLHTDIGAWENPGFPPVTVYGFWVNDPNYDPEGYYYGLPGKTYMTIDTFLSKFQPVSQAGDPYNGKYLAVVEPPQGINLNDYTGTVNYGATPSQFTPAQAKIVAKGGAIAQPLKIQAAKNAALDVLMYGVQNNLAQQFRSAVPTTFANTVGGYTVTFQTPFGYVAVDMGNNGVLKSFTLL